MVQLILLLIPVVNWFVEILVRWDLFFKKGGFINFIMALLVLLIGLPFGWIDFIWVILFNHLILA